MEHETTRQMMRRRLLEFGRIADQKLKLADQIVELLEQFDESGDPNVKAQLKDCVEEYKRVDSNTTIQPQN